MIELDIDVLVNGKPIKISQDLNDILSEYILKKVGITTRTNILQDIADNGPTIKHFKPAKVYGDEKRKIVSWTQDEETEFAVRVEELRKTGINFSEICRRIAPAFQDRTTGALVQKISELKKKGVIKII